MRKFIRNHVVELLGTIREGLDYALTADEKSKKNVLMDCLNAVNTVAEMMRQGFSPKRFEQYVQIMSEMFPELEALLTDADNANGIAEQVKKICKILLRITKLLNKEAEIETEIVFFPYKASMWDSLESIWRAASEDVSCFVSVVPIPYYDRGNDGSLVKLHYEGQDFPDYVDIVPYDRFNIELIEPDVAYIHNPYDGHNIVTSVHPAYYSYKLKKHVKALVYVPYYASDVTPSLSMAASAAAIAADLMIASSTEDAAAYRRGGVKYEIAALGSPKIDRIINLEKNRPEIPNEWAKLKGKKVFFLNTSVSSMLKEGEGYFNKIQALFSVFENRGDAALLWRPHPLTVATIQSMRPDLSEAYSSLARLVKNSNSAVIDLSPDMGTAIAVSDAYIGDGASSLVYLYALTGKPLYLINFKMSLSPTPDELTELLASDIFIHPCIDGDIAWAFCFSVNALCKLDIDTGRAEFVASVPSEANSFIRYDRPIKNGDRLLFPPIQAKEWAEYDIRLRTWTKYPIPNEALPKTRGGSCFFTAFDTDEFTIFAPIHSDAFVKYDKNTDKFEYHTKWYKSFEPYIFNINLDLFNFLTCQLGDSLYLTSIQSHAVLELNVQSMKTTIHKVGDISNRYYGIAHDGDCFWLTKYMMPETSQRQNFVMRWNKNTGICKEYPLQPVTYDPLTKASDFSSLAFFCGKILVFPWGVNEAFQIDPVTEEISLLEINLPYKLCESKSPYFPYYYGIAGWLFSVEEDKRLTFFSRYDNSLLILDAGATSFKKQKIVIEGIEHLLLNKDLTPPYVRGEEAFLTPPEYIGKVCSEDIATFDTRQAEYHRSVNVNSDGTCGNAIHKYVMYRYGKTVRS